MSMETIYCLFYPKKISFPDIEPQNDKPVHPSSIHPSNVYLSFQQNEKKCTINSDCFYKQKKK
ncbi:hypothetical protein DERF_001911 [Dermatophagoides farinae]|uniref:Uncharacterized protein n=1 Tax=Dermatophagoides farinae TaxID=6954 RepID=A0A922IEN4_DERFA|nr:hypothetical protein DERF_001911 [Dermatophagoides farinae]